MAYRTSKPLHPTEFGKPIGKQIKRKVKSKSATQTPDKVTTTKKKLVRSGRAYSRKLWGKDNPQHGGAFKEKTTTKEYKKLKSGEYSKKPSAKSKTVVKGIREDRRHLKKDHFTTTKTKSTKR